MKFTDRLRTAYSTFQRTSNSWGREQSGRSLAQGFFRNGNNRPLVEDWSKVIMDDRELYSGYSYASINNRANKVAQLASENLKTDAVQTLLDVAKKKDEEITHPYLSIIDNSPTFSNYEFWYKVSTYIDLEGVFYILVLRNSQAGGNPDGSTRFGEIQEFKLLNPYNIRRVRNTSDGTIGGYVETKDGLIRELPVEMIIDIRKMNPFSEDDPWAMTDAAKESQYTLKQAGDYTRHSLKNNMAAPGIISTDVLLDDQEFKNFQQRVTNQEKGMPLFGNGSGAITYESMQIDMDKASLNSINEINRQTMMAVSGVGKTTLSIEESGTTRDTARAQKEIFIENHVMPQLQLIIDALNQDYKTRYINEYQKTKLRLFIDNPLGSDRDAELKDVELRDESYKVYDTLVGAGYDRDIAAKYAQGEISLVELGEPTNEPRPNPVVEAAQIKSGETPQNAVVTPPDSKKKPVSESDVKPEKLKQVSEQNKLNAIELVHNEFDNATQRSLSTQQGSLQNSIVRIEDAVVNAMLNRVTQNAFDSDDDVISSEDKEEYQRELEAVLQSFYTVIIPILASRVLNQRSREYNTKANNFQLNQLVRNYISGISKKVGNSHIDTIIGDIKNTIKQTYDENVKTELQKQLMKNNPGLQILPDDSLDALTRKASREDLIYARKRALEGASRQRITSEVKNKYRDISSVRAKAIARTEMNRAFTQSQYQADLQFLTQNNLLDRAYKQWTTRSDNPCPVCQHLASEKPIPFTKNFADLGTTLKATYVNDKNVTKVQTNVVNFEPLESGNAHTNCSCIYVLIVQ